MQTRMAVIPARGGSKRLKDKNIFPLAGKPLISYTINAVLDSDCFETVVVSTDSDKIAEVALSIQGVSIYKRSGDMANEKVTVLEALLDMMKSYKKHDVFSFFLPTCPFRTAQDIQQGIKLLKYDVDSVISVCKYDQPMQLAMVKKKDDIIPIYDNLTSGFTNSRFFTPYYKPNGGYYISWWDKLIRNRNFFKGNIKGYEMPKERSIDIDYLLDIKYAEAVLETIGK
ncbi:MAG: hypothetical protein GF398_21080 [Chitinivibrionales bacterium]|nr:hypothetical protein [Chitinivibrionales bacterium]